MVVHLFAIAALVAAAAVTLLELAAAGVDRTIRWLIRRPPPR